MNFYESISLSHYIPNLLLLKFYPHHSLYHIPFPKSEKEFFCGTKVIEGPEPPMVFIDRVFFRFHSDMALFRFLIDRILFRVLSDRVFFESLVIGSSLGLALINSSLESSVLFFRCAAILLSNRAATFLSKTDVLFYIIFSKSNLHLIV